MNARTMIDSLRALCRDIDDARPPGRIDWKRILAPMAAPAVGLALLAGGGCGVAHERYPEVEVCDNGVDDDGDGLVDCDDVADCSLYPCPTPDYGAPFPDPAPAPEVCDNRLDDDLDGSLDCDDPDCADFEDCIPDVVPMYGEPFPEPEPEPMEDCCNLADDDEDGLVDCDDPDCGDALACAAIAYGVPFENICDNSRDDDCDGLVDCDDPDCADECGGYDPSLYSAPFDG